jgi:hypothetical protein
LKRGTVADQGQRALSRRGKMESPHLPQKGHKNMGRNVV